MDPSIILCQVYNTFASNADLSARQQVLVHARSVLPVPFVPSIPSLHSGNDPELHGSIEVATTEEMPNFPPDPLLCDVSRYNALQIRKDRFLTVSEDIYREARNRANPFEMLGKSIFMDRASMKCANADALYHFTGSLPSFLDMRNPGAFTFGDVASGPGGFSEYVLWRRPDAIGFGMTLSSGDRNLDWRRDRLDETRMNYLYGDSGTGNLFTEWKAFVRDTRAVYPEGLDLVMGDGGFNVERIGIPKDTSGSDPQEILRKRAFNCRRQEYLCQHLLVAQFLVGIAATKVGGAFFCKIFDTVTSLNAQVLYVVSLCFEETTIIKPMSSRPANAERYIYCKSRRDGVEKYLALLDAMNEAYTENTVVTSLLEGGLRSIDSSFLLWLREQNLLSLSRQEKAVAEIETLLDGRSLSEDRPSYDLQKALILWNLPDNLYERPRELLPSFPKPRQERPRYAGNFGTGRGGRQGRYIPSRR